MLRRAPTPGLMLSCHHAEILSVLSLNLCFVSKVQWNNGACVSRRDTGNLHIWHCLPTSLHRAFVMPFKQRILVDPPHAGVQQDSEQVQGQRMMSMTEWVDVKPQEVMLSTGTRTCLERKRRQQHSKKHEQRRNPTVFLLTHIIFPCKPTTYTERMPYVKGKEKTGQSIAPFPWILTLSMPKVRYW